MGSGRSAAVLLFTFASCTHEARAQDDWQFEITPYIWAAATDADVTFDSQTVRVKREFVEADFAASVLAVGQRDRLVTWTQLDFLSLDTDELEHAPASGRLESRALLATAGLGYRFGEDGGRSLDVLLGVRRLSLESKLKLDGLGSFKGDEDLTDPLIIVRPSWPLGERWRFNPTLSLGGADSKLTWEVQPQFSYSIMHGFTLRLGYRRVFYDFTSHDRRYNWDGAFQGWIIGIGNVLGD